MGGRESSVEAMDWFRVPWDQVANLVRSRSVFIEDGLAFVPEDALTEFVVAKFRAALSKWLAIMAKKRDLIFSDEGDRLEPILKSFGLHMNLEHDFSSEGGRVTAASLDTVAKTSFPPCMRQLLDGLKKDKKLKESVTNLTHRKRFECIDFRRYLPKILDNSKMPFLYTYENEFGTLD